MDTERKNLPIGIFDSGVGGLSVLRTALRLLPGERFIYYGDIANAPYGTKSEEEVRACADRVAKQLLDQGVKALVIACNTATCAAAAQLREKYPQLIIIGMEPALKLAHDQCPEGQILVLATPVSLASEKYHRLYNSYGERAVSLPCPGLMEFAERGELDSAGLRDYLSRLFSPFFQKKVEAIVLGCTHFPLLKALIGGVIGRDVTLISSAHETAIDVAEILARRGELASPDAIAHYEFNTTGTDIEGFERFGGRAFGHAIGQVNHVDLP